MDGEAAPHGAGSGVAGVTRVAMSKLSRVLPHSQPRTSAEVTYHEAVLAFCDAVKRCSPFEITDHIAMLTASRGVFVAKTALLRASGTVADELAAQAVEQEIAWIDDRITCHIAHLPN